MTREPEAPPSRWSDAVLAAAMLAVDPQGLRGIHVQARAGEVRDRWLTIVSEAFGPAVPHRRIAAGIAEARLSGGLDIGLTLEGGRPVIERGVLSCADGGVLVVAMAERLARGAAAMIGIALDEGEVRIERDGLSERHFARFALIALDEGIEADECLAPLLADRLGLRIDLDTVGWREAGATGLDLKVVDARALLPHVSIGEAMTEALCGVALSVAGPSMRASLHLLRAARAVAALGGRTAVEREDAATALRLVLGLQAPAQEEQEEKDEADDRPADAGAPEELNRSEQRPDDGDEKDDLNGDALEDMLLAASEAVLPERLLIGLQAGAAHHKGSRGAAGKAGADRPRGTRGRAVGTVSKPPVPGARLDVLATLRQAAPWQRLRALAPAAMPTTMPISVVKLFIRKSDFRYIRYRDKTGTTAIFAVDASGSAATQRLAETKGAIELLLGECYVRRDSVALVSFRGRQADTLLEPTRSLVRAKRSLAALPGGGGTPLAGGILATLRMAEASIRQGQSVVAVFLTDGRGNVALDGTTGTADVNEDTGRAARLFRGFGVRSLLIDTAPRPQARARDLARDLGAEYLALPRGGSGAVAREVGARMEG